MARDGQDPLLETLKKAARALKHADIRFALAGSLAAYARGGVLSRLRPRRLPHPLILGDFLRVTAINAPITTDSP
ncbi:hypothetical protein SAMN05216276_102547 [Streptosporangium subroseum]|uniref:Uncharacterized protein n=1 Tax=Streptosporangium subroseum TaxID=106412 RepID=A0A239K485_9ACTN|nr:hypothetical protein SAMN05216276_102547 [Streptosporangium subroseum]